MDSFSIKYEIDDLCDENNFPNVFENNQDETLITEKNKCICLRLARLFSDLLTKDKAAKKCENSKSRDSSSSSCPSTRSSNNAMFSATENNTKSFQSEFKIINKELKLIRDGQNELLEKYDLIFKQISSKLIFTRKNYNNLSHFAQKRFASKSDLNDCDQRKSSSIKQTLIGAKKRKFNSATLNRKSNFLKKKLILLKHIVFKILKYKKEKRSSSSIDSSTSSINSSQTSSVLSNCASSTNNSKNSHKLPENFELDQNEFDEDCSINEFVIQENANLIGVDENKNHNTDELLNAKNSDESNEKEPDCHENTLNDCEINESINKSIKKSSRAIISKSNLKSNYRLENEIYLHENGKF